MRNLRASAAPLLICGLLLLPLLYAGSYLALLQPQDRLMMGEDGICRSGRRADYRAGGQTSDKVFWTAHRVDLAIRPRYWGERR